MELMRHSDAKLTTQVYTDARMLPIWDAVGALPTFNDTQIDTQNLVVSSQKESGAVPLKKQSVNLLGAGSETFSQSETATIPISPSVEESAPCRNRICDSNGTWQLAGNDAVFSLQVSGLSIRGSIYGATRISTDVSF